MSIQERSPELVHGSFETFSPEAYAFMKSEGFVLVPGMIDWESCDAAVTSLHEGRFQSSPVYPILSERFLYMASVDNVRAFQSIEACLLAAIREVAGDDFAMKEWFTKPEEGVNPFETHIFKFVDGLDFGRHVDDPIHGSRTQTLLTLQGSGELLIFPDMEAEDPIFRVPVHKGDVVFMRGDEFFDGQLPHAVQNNQNRMLMDMVPKREYDRLVEGAQWVRQSREERHFRH